MVFMTFHFAESATNLLTSDAVDPTAKIPEYKVCAVRKLERLPAPILQGEFNPESEPHPSPDLARFAAAAGDGQEGRKHRRQ
jgi:formate dehydrogenase major subunit